MCSFVLKGVDNCIVFSTYLSLCLEVDLQQRNVVELLNFISLLTSFVETVVWFIAVHELWLSSWDSMDDFLGFFIRYGFPDQVLEHLPWNLTASPISFVETVVSFIAVYELWLYMGESVDDFHAFFIWHSFPDQALEHLLWTSSPH